MDDAKLKRKLAVIKRETKERVAHFQSLMIDMKHFEKWKTWGEGVDFALDELRKSIK